MTETISRSRYVRLSRQDRALLKTYCCEHGMAWPKSESPIMWGKTIYELRQLKKDGETAQTRANIVCPFVKPVDLKPHMVWWQDFDWDAPNPWPDDKTINLDPELCNYCYSTHASILDQCEIQSRVEPFQMLMEAYCPPVRDDEPLTDWESFAIAECNVPMAVVLESRVPVQLYDEMEKRRKARTGK